MWWLQSDWKDTTCDICGKNIWNSGGDPDHGLCYDCWYEQQAQQKTKQEQNENYKNTKTKVNKNG